MACWMTTFEATKETTEGFIRMFECERCNRCETEVGMVFLSPLDIRRLTKNLGIDVLDFLEIYTFYEDGKRFLPTPCPFFDGEGCMIHDFKPSVCLTFPFNQTVKCGDRNMLTINTGCPAGAKMAKLFAINPESVGVKV